MKQMHYARWRIILEVEGTDPFVPIALRSCNFVVIDQRFSERLHESTRSEKRGNNAKLSRSLRYDFRSI